MLKSANQFFEFFSISTKKSFFLFFFLCVFSCVFVVYVFFLVFLLFMFFFLVFLFLLVLAVLCDALRLRRISVDGLTVPDTDPLDISG